MDKVCTVCSETFKAFDRKRKYCSTYCSKKEENRRYREKHHDVYLANKAAYRQNNADSIREYNKVSKNNLLRPLYSKDTCLFCDSDDRLHLHHVIPIRLGGKNTVSNLMILCFECHALWHSKVSPITDVIYGYTRKG